MCCLFGFYNYSGKDITKLSVLTNSLAKVETDSYVAVQLLEMKKHLNVKNIKFMAEKVEGSFAFTIVDSADTLWLIRGDSPLSLIHFPKYKLYVYASTDEILYKALVDTKLFEEIKKCDFEEIQVDTGDILHILKDGTIVCNKFEYKDYSFFGRSHHWWDYGYESEIFDASYIDELKSIAPYQGFAAEDIDELIESGFSPEEIEEYIYCIG